MGLILDGMNGVKGHLLEIGPVFSRRLQPVKSKLRGDIIGGDISAACAGTTAFEEVAREKAHLGTDLFRINGGRSLTGSFRNTGDDRNGSLLPKRQQGYEEKRYRS